MNWLVATQHQDGGWSYRPSIGDGNQAVGGIHGQTTHSMTAAGAGMLYVAAHLFGFGTTPDQNPDGVPPAPKRVDDQAKRGGVTLTAKDVNRPAMENAMKGGNTCFARNPSDNVRWRTHYYMYGLERYKSFQELVEGSQVKEPDWYNKGVEFLKKTQQADGSWVSPDAPTSNATIDTAFAACSSTGKQYIQPCRKEMALCNLLFSVR